MTTVDKMVIKNSLYVLCMLSCWADCETDISIQDKKITPLIHPWRKKFGKLDLKTSF